MKEKYKKLKDAFFKYFKYSNISDMYFVFFFLDSDSQSKINSRKNIDNVLQRDIK